LLPCEAEPRWHAIGDVRDVLDGSYHLLIAHPPCTYLANSGARWLYSGGRSGTGMDPDRVQHTHDAADLFRWLIDRDVPHAVENPIQHRLARDLIGRRYSQIIQPWQFGVGETKATCLWLHKLPPLVPTHIVKGRDARVHRASPGPDRWKERSRTPSGIAAAMAQQWGDWLLEVQP
jgi:hypothetical protein